MRLPLGEQQIGVVKKSNYSRTYYFIPDYRYAFDNYKKQGMRVMTFAEFKKEFPYQDNNSKCRKR